MRVLVVHNRYRSHLPSGENRVVDDEVAAMRDAGVDGATFFRSSDELATLTIGARAHAALGPITALARHRRAWSSVARFLAVSDVVARRLTSWGLPPNGSG